MGIGGLPSARLDRVRVVLASHVERGAAPGLVALVSRRGETHAVTQGSLALGGHEPMRRDAIFRIASMTKPVTAVAAMILVEECALRLEDPVDELLPELADRQVLKRIDGPLDDTVPANRPITLRDLLVFTAGYGMVLASPDSYPIQRAISELGLIGFGPPDPSSTLDPDEWIRRLGALPLMHQPGEEWLYGTGSYVLGVLIERAARQPFEAFLRERIFEPLGMADTGFFVPASKIDRLATGYSTDGETGQLTLFDGPEKSQWSKAPAFPDGGGGLVSTADDMLAFGRMLLDDGVYDGGRILSRPSVGLMTSDHLTAGQRAASSAPSLFLDGQGWGFGLSIITHRDGIASTPGKYGWNGGFGTSWTVDPKEELITVLMTQASFTSAGMPAVHRDFATAVYQAIDD